MLVIGARCYEAGVFEPDLLLGMLEVADTDVETSVLVFVQLPVSHGHGDVELEPALIATCDVGQRLYFKVFFPGIRRKVKVRIWLKSKHILRP